MLGYDMFSRNNDVFSIDRTMDVLTEEHRMSKKVKYFDKMLNNKSFYGYVFIGSDGPKREKLKTFYNTMTTMENIKAVYEVLRDNNDFPRTAAPVLYSVCCLVIDECNKVADDIDASYRNGNMRRSEKDDKYDEIERKFAYAKKINDNYLNDMVKPFAKKLSRKTGIPRETCIDIAKSVPEKAYIDKDSVGGYMNIITENLYTSLDDVDDDFDDIDWETFFRMVIGEQYLKDVAMYLTVEGASRIKRDWRNAARIGKIWDSLTVFALNTLEDLTENDRDHVLGLYKKIVASMSGDSKNDLRVDLTKIDEDVFPNIAKSVEKCYGKLKEAIDIAKGKKERFKQDDDLPTLN